MYFILVFTIKVTNLVDYFDAIVEEWRNASKGQAATIILSSSLRFSLDGGNLAVLSSQPNFSEFKENNMEMYPYQLKLS